jgi:methylthioribose-1-phosphate isomerase
LTALRRLRDEGQALRLFVTEGRPFMDGARLASWELRAAGLEHRVVPDAAVAWLLARETIDAVLIDAEWIAANGDVGAIVGSRGVAQLAVANGTRVVVSGATATIDETAPDGAAIPLELRPAGDLVAYLADTPVRAADALVPATDVVPAAAVYALVTERGTVASGATG